MSLAEATIAEANISDLLQILSYQNSQGKNLTVLSKVEIGSPAKPIAGNGIYSLVVKVDDTEIVPGSDVRVGVKAYVLLQSRDILLGQGQTITVHVKGLPADTAVAIETILADNTPVLSSDLTGIGAIPVDHDYGGADSLRVVDPDGAGIQDATIMAYLAADYVAGSRTANFVRGRVTTSVSGRWRSPLLLDIGDYKLVVAKPGLFSTNVIDLQVSNL